MLVAVVELPASIASAQLSPSESRSKRFGMPSLSVSISAQTGKIASALIEILVFQVADVGPVFWNCNS